MFWDEFIEIDLFACWFQAGAPLQVALTFCNRFLEALKVSFSHLVGFLFFVLISSDFPCMLWLYGKIVTIV